MTREIMRLAKMREQLHRILTVALYDIPRRVYVTHPDKSEYPLVQKLRKLGFLKMCIKLSEKYAGLEYYCITRAGITVIGGSIDDAK